MLAVEASKFDVNENGLALLLGELDHRVRNFLSMVESVIRQTESTSVGDYRSKLLGRLTALYSHSQLTSSYRHAPKLAELLERALHPHVGNADQVVGMGPDVDLEPSLALALHLVFHELATNAKKYGALSSPLGRVRIVWKLRDLPDAPRKLAILWTEQGGPKVKRPRHRGFGSRLIRTALDGYGVARLDFHSSGLACFMSIDPDHGDARLREGERFSLCR
jgi:two-component sensor histidine kinase